MNAIPVPGGELCHYFQIYGLTLRCNRPVAFLRPLTHAPDAPRPQQGAQPCPPTIVDVRFLCYEERNDAPQPLERLAYGLPAWRCADGLLLDWDQMRVAISEDGRRVTTWVVDAAPLLPLIFMGPVMGCVLHCHDRLAVHGSLVAHR